MEDLAFRNQFSRQVPYPGIRTALGLDRGTGSTLALKSDITYKHWNSGIGELGESKSQRPKRVFKYVILHLKNGLFFCRKKCQIAIFKNGPFLPRKTLFQCQ